jgi:hypothetical protein
MAYVRKDALQAKALSVCQRHRSSSAADGVQQCGIYVSGAAHIPRDASFFEVRRPFDGALVAKYTYCSSERNDDKISCAGVSMLVQKMFLSRSKLRTMHLSLACGRKLM